MISSESLTASLQKHFLDPSLIVMVKSEWGSQNASHRELMKSELASIPEFQNPILFSSISHCDGLGIAVASAHPVGVDIEITKRVTEPIVARVSAATEVHEAPSFASLWSAKEASFKALRAFNQPSVLSSISVGDWQNIDSQTETYRLLNASRFSAPSENSGVVLRASEYTCAIFLFSS